MQLTKLFRGKKLESPSADNQPPSEGQNAPNHSENKPKKKPLLRRMSIGLRLLAAFGVIILLLAGMGFVGISGMKSIGALDQVLYENMTVPLSDLVVMADSFQRIRADLGEVIASGNNANQQKYAATVRSNADKLSQTFDNYENSISDKEEKQSLNQIKK